MGVVGGDGGAGSGGDAAGYDVQYRMADGEERGELVAEEVLLKSTWHRQSTSACASWAALQPDHRHGYGQIRQRMSAWASVSKKAGKREKVAQNSKNSRGDTVEGRCAAAADVVVVVGDQGMNGIAGDDYRFRCDVRYDSRTNWVPGRRTGCGGVENTNRLGDYSSMRDAEEE